MNVSLSAAAEKLVRSKLTSGKFKTVEDVVEEALRRFDDFESSRESRIQAMKDAVNVALEQVERGEVYPLDMNEFIAELEAKYNRA